MTSKNKPVFNKIGEDFSSGPILTSVEDLEQDKVIPETVIRVKGARVVYANYDLLKHDFPQLQDHIIEKEFPGFKLLKGIAKQKAVCNKIDEWLIRNTAFISQSQAQQSVVNTAISTGKETVKAFRPPGYGRALVFSIEENNAGLLLSKHKKKSAFENRLIDVKGTGVAPDVKPVNELHGNGIYQLGYAFVELVTRELLQRIFRHSKTVIQTLPVYGIIDLGFDELDNLKCKRPAALLVRRAHRRPKDSGGLFAYDSTGQHVQLEIEKLLRRYGITSVNNVTTIKVWKENGQLQIQYDDQKIDFFNKKEKAEIERVSHYKDGMGLISFDGINIQHTREMSLNPTHATLVDFQTYTVKKTFDDPLLSLVSDKLLRWGGSIWPDYEDFVKPIPELQIPFHLISSAGTVLGYNMGKGKKKINSLCFGLAEDFRANKISRKKILDTLQTYLDSLTKHWKNK